MTIEVTRPLRTNAMAEYDREVARRRNQPRPPVPHWFEYELERIRGRDTISNKPNFRLVWGQSKDAMKLVMVNGEAQFFPKYLKEWYQQLIRIDIAGQEVSPVIDRREPIGHDCFFIEKLLPARLIPRDAWEDEWRWYCDPNDPLNMVDVMGPFPNEGMYIEYLCMRDGATEEAVPPSQTVLDDLAARLAWERSVENLGPTQVVQKIINARRAEEIKQDLLHVQQLHDVLSYYAAGIAGNRIVDVLTNNLQPLSKVS